MASTRQEYGEATKPDAILKDIVDHENSDIIRTKLDDTTNISNFWASNKLSGTLESVRQYLSFYLQWIAYFALAGSVTLLIYNGLLLATSPLSPEQATKVKTRMFYISAWVVLVTWFYFVLKIILAIYYDVIVD
jgi:hypothetical protein